MKNNRLVVIVIVGVALVLIFWVKQYFSPERVVHRKFLAAVVAFEKELLLGTIQVITRTYLDSWGQSYESIAGNVSEMMATFDDLDVDLLETSADRTEDGVRMRLRFVVSGSDGDGDGAGLGSHNAPCTASIFWRKEPSGWRISTTESLDIPELRDELDALHRGR